MSNLRKLAVATATTLALAGPLVTTSSAQAATAWPLPKLHSITTWASAPGWRMSPYAATKRVGTLWAGTHFVYCKRKMSAVSGSEGTNYWWLWTELDTPRGEHGWVSAYYLSGQGDNEARLNNGGSIPLC